MPNITVTQETLDLARRIAREQRRTIRTVVAMGLEAISCRPSQTEEGICARCGRACDPESWHCDQCTNGGMDACSLE